jgi:hypothetical protein
MKRYKMKSKKSKKYFKKTAGTNFTHKMNLGVRPMRGGTRL